MAVLGLLGLAGWLVSVVVLVGCSLARFLVLFVALVLLCSVLLEVLLASIPLLLLEGFSKAVAPGPVVVGAWAAVEERVLVPMVSLPAALNLAHARSHLELLSCSHDSF